MIGAGVLDKSGTESSGISAEKALDLTDELIAAAREEAERLGVCPTLHECDQLLGYIVKYGSGGERAARDYIVDGRNHAHQIATLLDRLGMGGKPARVLEFASGYGRITRHLKSMAPKALHFASDIHNEACDFIAGEIGVTALPSAMNPAKLNIGKNYDLIFVISLFSHLPSHSFGNWLRALYGILAPGGYLMFTTHGQSARATAPEFWDSILVGTDPGYGFRSASDQSDISSAEYGTTLAMPRYVTKQIAEHLPSAKLTSFTGGAWFTIQDEWIIQKPVEVTPVAAS